MAGKGARITSRRKTPPFSGRPPQERPCPAQGRGPLPCLLYTSGLDPAVFLQRRRHELSGGESQRVALAARLALRPRVLLMDEPTASVDQQSAERIAVAARHAADEGSAVVVVSHDQEWLAPLADRLVTLREGKLA